MPQVIPDLERLIRLQQLDTAADEARRKIADHPERAQQLDEALQSARDRLADVKGRLTTAQERRRVDEKEVAAVQARLAKYKDQLLEVKTNREYRRCSTRSRPRRTTSGRGKIASSR